jgi:hypothetical protein
VAFDSSTVVVETDEVLECLRRAREIIAKKKQWCQWHLAETKNGSFCYPMTNEAVSFCALGAILRANGEGYAGPTFYEGLSRQAVLAVAHANNLGKTVSAIAEFNNYHRHVDVLKAFDKAILSLS